MRTGTILLASCLALSGCSLIRDFDGYSAGEGGVDASADASDDAKVDGSGDAAVDAATDAATDAGADAATDAGADAATDAGADAATDAGADAATDAGADAGGPPCTPACGGGSICCEGVCVDTSTSLSNCGGCGAACSDELNASATCTGGSCTQACDDGFLDCSSGAAGCEASDLDVATCGSCGNACAAVEVCQDTASFGPTCVTSCSAGDMECGGSCVDIDTDVSHCGGCDMACPSLNHTTRSCVSSNCVYACVSPFEDCDGDLMDPATSNGCEVVPATYYADGDGDGVGAGVGTTACPGEEPTGSVTASGDCNDSNGDVFPGNPELCNGLDEDCDGTPDEGLNWMGVGLGDSCSCESGALSSTVTCNAMEVAECAFPAESCNGLDDDCDGTPDDIFACAAGSTGSCTVTAGSCTATGTRSCDGLFCSWGACVTPPEVCDGNDEDCDGFVDDNTYAFGGPNRLVGAVVTVPHIALHPTAGMGGAVVYYLSSTPRRIVWQKLNENLTLSGAPVVIAQDAQLSFIYGFGWDGAKWSIFYTILSSGVGVAYHARVSATGTLTAGVSLGDGYDVRAVGDGNSVGVLLRNVDLGMYVGVYDSTGWRRALEQVVPGSAFDAWYDLDAVGGGTYVAAVAEDAGTVKFWSFDNTTLGSGISAVHSVLTDTGLESPLDVATDRAGRVAIGWKKSGVQSTISIFDISSGAPVASRMIGLGDVDLAFEGGEFFLESSGVVQRVAPSDASISGGTYRGSGSISAIGAWRGAYRLARISVDSSGPLVTNIYGLGCP